MKNSPRHFLTELPRHLTGIAVIALAAFVLWGMFHWELAEANREVAYMVCGFVIGWAGNVVNYHFGTSEGSKSKTDLLAGSRPPGPNHDERV